MSMDKANEFFDYASKFQKQYLTEDEMVQAAQAYNEMDQFIQKWNANPDATSTVGHNMFSDMTKEQKSAMIGKIPVQDSDNI